MVDVTQARRYLWVIFKLAAKHGTDLKVRYDNKIYILSVTPTGETVARKKMVRDKQIKRGVKLQTAICTTCNGMAIDGVCLNKMCKGMPIVPVVL